MTLLGIRAGRVRFRESSQGEWRSAIEKVLVPGPVSVHDEGLLPDEQADRVNHGGVDKAILAYCVDHYPLWRAELHRADLVPGAMGENLDVTGQTESTVCVGDIYRVGKVILQVSQPRQPCWKPALLHGISQLTKLIAEKGRTGWYLRVLETGILEAPCPIELLDRPHPHWSIERANRILYHRAEGRDAAAALSAVPELSSDWRGMLAARA